MPFPSLRRKSKQENIIRQEGQNDQRTRANPPTTPPDSLLSPRSRPRQASSFYSQPSISGIYTNAFLPPPIPGSYVNQQDPELKTHPAPSALLSLDEAAQQAAWEWSHERDESVSTYGTPRNLNPYMTEQKRNAVSEYLRERTWTPSTISGHGQLPPPIQPMNSTQSSASRRFSVASSINRRLSQNSRRRSQQSRRHSSITTLPYAVSEVPETLDAFRQDGSQRSSWMFGGYTSGGASLDRPGESFVSMPYDQTRRASKPIHIPTISLLQARASQQASRPSNQVVSASRALSQRYRAHDRGPVPPCSTSGGDVSYSKCPCGRTTSYPRIVHPALRHAPVLQSRTRDPVDSEESSWLFIGTLRGPSPAAVRRIDEIMAAQIAKYAAKDEQNGYEKGLQKACDKIRELLKKENRIVIEWIEAYIKRRWGVELLN